MRILLVLLALVSSGCTQGGWLEVDAPFVVPDQADALHVRVWRGPLTGGDALLDKTFPLSAKTPFPVTLSLPTDDAANYADGISIEASALWQGAPAAAWASASGHLALEHGKYPHLVLTLTPTLPTAPTGVTATQLGPTTFQLDWEESQGDVVSYTVFRRDTHGDPQFEPVGSVAADTRRFVDRGLNLWFQYDYLIVATGRAGAGPASALLAGVQLTGGTSKGAIDVKSAGAVGDGVADDTAAIRTALGQAGAGGIFFPSGIYRITSTIELPPDATLTGASVGPTLKSDGAEPLLRSSGGGLTMATLVLDGAGLSGSAPHSQGGWTIVGCTFQNIVSGADAIHVDDILTVDDAGTPNVIAANTFDNVWQGGEPNLPAGHTESNCGTECVAGSGIYVHGGWDHVLVDRNTFDWIGYVGIKGGWDDVAGSAAGWMFQTQDVRITRNVFTHGRRKGIELQGIMSGDCPGGCVYDAVLTTGMVIEGNVWNSRVIPGATAMTLMGGGTDTLYANNTALIADDSACSATGTDGLETALGGGLIQGNVIGVTSNCSGAGWSTPLSISYSPTGATATFSNNAICGAGASDGGIVMGPSQNATVEEHADQRAETCPASVTSGTVQVTFTSADGQSHSHGGVGTFSVAVDSGLSVGEVSFFLDDADCAFSTQTLADRSDGFSTDRLWRFHVDLDVWGLAAGAHTVKVVARDVAGASASASQSFTR